MQTHPVLIVGGILGLGIGGFFDGIVLHQVLQWHHVICVTAHCQTLTLEQAMAFLASGMVLFLVGWSMLPPVPVQRIPAYA